MSPDGYYVVKCLPMNIPPVISLYTIFQFEMQIATSIIILVCAMQACLHLSTIHQSQVNISLSY